MADQDFDLSEEATPYKLEQARKQGSVAKSQDFTAVAILAAMVGTVYASGWDSITQSAKLTLAILARATHLEWTADSMAVWIGRLALDMLHILSPLFVMLVIAAILSSLFQTGPIFSAKPLSPDLNRINPSTGFKRLFSMRILYESVKSIFKLVILSAVIYSFVSHAIPGMLGLSGIDAKELLRILVDLTGSLLVKLVFALLVIALIDWVFTRWEFAKRMRMSRRDVKDEYKQREGDPRIRSRIREMRKEMLKRSKATRNLPSADVLITNPTRIAVALRYQHGESGAPQLVAKGAGELARKMRQLAGRHQIPVVQNRLLARALFREVGYEEFVPEKFYSQVAKIMVWVYTMRQMRQTEKGVA